METQSHTATETTAARQLKFFNLPLHDYVDEFVQRKPKYVFKHYGKKDWRTVNKPLADPAIQAHLEGKYCIGTVAPWYPKYAIFDLDDVTRELAEQVRDDLKLDSTNSMICSSESRDSYHIVTRVLYNGNPLSRYRLNQVLKDTVAHFSDKWEKRIEVYPLKGKAVRLPFGKHQNCLDPKYRWLSTWESKLYWFKKLNEVDLASMPYHQMVFDLKIPADPEIKLVRSKDIASQSLTSEAEFLLTHGLQAKDTRYYSEYRILLYLWRKNTDLKDAIDIVWKWIQKKHNGFSDKLLKYPRTVREEIKRQAFYVYTTNEFTRVYPDTIHNGHNGYITEPDIRDIVQICNGNLPRMRFTFQLIKYSYPRRHRAGISIHRDKFVHWSSKRTYNKYLNELNAKGLLKRGKSYVDTKLAKDTGMIATAKKIFLTWKYRDSNQAILIDGRSIDGFEDTLAHLYKPDEFKCLIRAAGCNKFVSRDLLTSVYG